MVRVINYGIIQPNTIIKLSISNITTLSSGLVNTISIAVVIFYNSIGTSAYLYIPTAHIAVATTYKPNVGNYGFSLNYAGNNVVLQSTNISYYIQPYPNMYQSNPSIYYTLKFSPNILLDPYNPVGIVTCTGCMSV
jgi:hypothetical protein